MIKFYEISDRHENLASFEIPGTLATVSVSMTFGLVLFSSPQTGMIMLLYRIYLISVDRTCREDYWVIFSC